MNLIELFVIAVGVSMDAFAVAICKGLSLEKITLKKAGIVGLYFGLFQAGMPLLGYLLGMQFQNLIANIDHWVAFTLLTIIGIQMVKESRSHEECPVGGLDFKNMSVLAISTSIDALAVGISFAFLQVDIIPAVTFIGIITFTLSLLGVLVGNIFGSKYKSKAELVGGLVLIIMGIKILVEHTTSLSI